MKAEIKEFMEALKAKTVGESLKPYGIPIRQIRNTKPIRFLKKWWSLKE